MSYICCLRGFIEPSKSLGGKYEPSEKFRGKNRLCSFIILVLVLFKGNRVRTVYTCSMLSYYMSREVGRLESTGRDMRSLFLLPSEQDTGNNLPLSRSR
jgi:hypothetical protein